MTKKQLKKVPSLIWGLAVSLIGILLCIPFLPLMFLELCIRDACKIIKGEKIEKEEDAENFITIRIFDKIEDFIYWLI